jgi:hypothetical protein
MKVLSILVTTLAVSTAAFHASNSCRANDQASSASATTGSETMMDPSIPRDLDAFKEWSDAHGIILAEGLELLSSDEGDWSLNHSKDLKEAQCLLTIPKSMIMSSTKVKKELGSKVEKASSYLKDKKIEEQCHQFYLWIRLLQEFEKGSESRWYGWMQSLPRTFDTAVSMDDVELELLPPFAWTLAKMVRFHYRTFLEALEMVEDDTLSIEIKSNEELLQWVFNVVFTRCWGKADFDDENRHDLVPMGDMFNHGEPSNVFIDYDEETNDCNIVLKEDADPSTSLKLSYGHATTPSKFLSIFGFVDLSQPKIFCQILSSSPSKRHVDVGYDTDKMLFDTRDGSISNEVWDFTLYSILEQLPEIQELFYQAHMKKDKETKADLHKKYYLETCIVIKKHVDETLKVLDELLQKILALEKEDHPRLETIYRHNLFFHQTFWKVQQRLNVMIRQEMESRRQ